MHLTPGRLVFPSGQSMGVINETGACCLIANGSGYSMVRSVSPSEAPAAETSGKEHASASPRFSLSSLRPSKEIPAVSGVALWSCPVGGEEGGQVQACFQPTAFLPFSPLITVQAAHACARRFSHLLASLTVLPAAKG